MTRSQIGAIIGSILMAAYIMAIIISIIIGPQDPGPKFPPIPDQYSLPYDARYM